MWSEEPAIQVVAIRMLQRLAHSHQWAKDLLEEAFLDEQIETWINQID